MSRIFIIFILITANKAQEYSSIEEKYAYVVALLSDDYRTGTGTLLRSKWVLTCAHCVDDTTHIQYGDMTIPPERSKTKKKVTKRLQYTGYHTSALSNDIGLCKVKSVPLWNFGELSPVEFRSLVGRTIVYAGYGNSEYSDGDGKPQPLHTGEGIVTSCGNQSGPYLCFKPKFKNIKYLDLTEGYTGGPVFSDDKIVGIVRYGIDMTPIGRITAIMPYQYWILQVMAGIKRLP